jgi:4-hydroxymandelate oxidase
VLSTQSSTPLEAVAQAVRGDPGRGPLWFQLYWQADRGFNRALVQRAEAAGYEAIVLTADAPVQGVRDRERRAGFTPPPGVRAVHLQDAPAAPLRPPAPTAPACRPTPPPGTTSPGCGAAPACRCGSRACCTRRTRARRWRWAWPD